MPGDLRGVKPTNESCNRHTDLVPAVDPKVVCEPFPSPFSCSLGVPRGKPTKLCQTVDYERALNLVKCYSQSASNFASRETWKETLLNKTQEILKVSLKIFDFSLLSCNQEQSSQPSQPTLGGLAGNNRKVPTALHQPVSCLAHSGRAAGTGM